MKNSFIIFLFVALALNSVAQSTSRQPILYGSFTEKSLTQIPYRDWYQLGYDQYIPDSSIIIDLKKSNLKNIRIEIFMGTWCGDSRREVPRFTKLLDAFSFPQNKLAMYGLGGSDSLYKQSPEHEEAGKGIFRVPTFIVYENGKEIGRINEFPVVSLEKDLMKILNKEIYAPNYKSFSLVNQWLQDKTLLDVNSSIRGLAGQLKMLVENEHELNGLGYVLLKQGKVEEAVSIFRINANLYPESANVLSSLGEGYHAAGNDEKAVSFLERSLEINKDPALAKEILQLLYTAKGVK